MKDFHIFQFILGVISVLLNFCDVLYYIQLDQQACKSKAFTIICVI